MFSVIIGKIDSEIAKIIENEVRQEFGFKKIGEQWLNETLMFHIVQSLFPQCNVFQHYRPKWLQGLELDVFVDTMNIGFEYQGIQHFKPIKHWGGPEKLAIQQEHDKRKRELCNNQGVKLITICYNEPISESLIRIKLREE